MADIEYLGRTDWVERVEGTSMPVLVEFVTQTCPVCRSMAPAVDNLADKYKGRARVYKVDVDREQALAALHGIQGVPTFKVYCKGAAVAMLSGGVYPKMLEQLIEHALEAGGQCAEKRTKVTYEITGYG